MLSLSRDTLGLYSAWNTASGFVHSSGWWELSLSHFLSKRFHPLGHLSSPHTSFKQQFLNWLCVAWGLKDHPSVNYPLTHSQNLPPCYLAQPNIFCRHVQGRILNSENALDSSGEPSSSCIFENREQFQQLPISKQKSQAFPSGEGTGKQEGV